MVSLSEECFEIENQKKKHFHRDLSFWALVVTNLIVIVQALWEGWPLGVIMWIYWGQSVAIGIFWFFKILTLREFSTEGFRINDRPVQPTTSTKIQTSVFFLFHYGFFHLGYAVFLFSKFGFVPFSQALTAIGIFVIYQGYSFFYNRKWQAKQKPNIGIMMFFPYARIIPMHLTIIFASSSWGQKQALAFFLFLKLLADVIMHIVESKGFSDSKH
jgi:hypothetical protein